MAQFTLNREKYALEDRVKNVVNLTWTGLTRREAAFIKQLMKSESFLNLVEYPYGYSFGEYGNANTKIRDYDIAISSYEQDVPQTLVDKVIEHIVDHYLSATESLD
ncbi:hypothetical protein [Spirosoma agri]